MRLMEPEPLLKDKNNTMRIYIVFLLLSLSLISCRKHAVKYYSLADQNITKLHVEYESEDKTVLKLTFGNEGKRIIYIKNEEKLPFLSIEGKGDTYSNIINQDRYQRFSAYIVFSYGDNICSFNWSSETPDVLEIIQNDKKIVIDESKDHITLTEGKAKAN